jgi:hypothetical protein
MARQPGRTVYTIGHSSYPQGRFLDMLGRWLENERRAGVEFDGAVIVDIRSRPGSRRFPQYDSERMSRWIKEKTGGRVQYKHEPRLGGLRDRAAFTRFPIHTIEVSGASRSGRLPTMRNATLIGRLRWLPWWSWRPRRSSWR